MSTNPNQPVMAPILDPGLAGDLAAREAAEKQYAVDFDEIQKLKALLAAAKNPMMLVQLIMMDIMNLSGDKMSGLSAVDNIETDLRNKLSGSQNDFNGVGGAKPNDPNAPGQATSMSKELDDIEAFLNYEKSLPANQQAISGSSIDNILNAITNVKAQFGSDWGNGTAMVADIQKWVAQGGKGGTYAPQLNAIQNGYETTNQSVSALSTATNTDLQFTGEQFKQYMGIAQAVGQAMLKFYLATINNEKTN